MSNRIEDALETVGALRQFQEKHQIPVSDFESEAPAQALSSLRDAAKNAPAGYVDYLNEAVACYERELYRASILMIWAATIEHLYSAVENRQHGVRDIEAQNLARFGTSRAYKEIKNKQQLRYLSESNFLQLCEDAGMINRNARKRLIEWLDVRNMCGHPTNYMPGRETTVVFVEELILNVLGGTWVTW